MKILKNILILALTVSAGLGTVSAQTTRKDRKAAKEAAIKTNVENKTYTFEATYVMPLRGGGHSLSSPYYDVKVTKDSVISFLPYFGRAYFDVPYNPTDGGIKFTSTKFDYKITEKKKGWQIDIKPTDVRDIQAVTIDISSDGYASLSVRSVNRDFISFNGNLKETAKKN